MGVRGNAAAGLAGSATAGLGNAAAASSHQQRHVACACLLAVPSNLAFVATGRPAESVGELLRVVREEAKVHIDIQARVKVC